MYPFHRRRRIINYTNNYSCLKNGFALWNFPVFSHLCPWLTYSYHLIRCSYACSFGRASVFVSNRSSEGNIEKKCLFELAPVRLGPFLAVKTDTHPSTRIINCIDCANMAGLQHLWNVYKKFLCYSNDFHFSYSNSFLCVLVSYCIQRIPRTRSVFHLLFIFVTERTV